MDTVKSYIPSVVFAVALMLVPLAIWTEHHDATTWGSRLAIPEFETEHMRHTPIHTEGTYLPPVITKNLTLTAAESPILLPASTRIVAGVTLTLADGAHVHAHEFATLRVEGILRAQGTSESPVVFSSNELHPENRIWGGITVIPQGRSQLEHTIFHDASPAITCTADSRVTARAITIVGGALGAFIQSPECTIADSSIRGVRQGVIAIGVTPTLPNTTIVATHEPAIRVYTNAQ